MKVDVKQPPSFVPSPAIHDPPRGPPQTGRSLVPVKPPRPPEVVPGSGRTVIESPLKQIRLGVNARAMSPRAIHALSEDLYAGGVLSWDEHAALSFQIELHPHFGRTVGALTGEKPLPDQPRDFVKEWEARLDFERRHFPDRPERDLAAHILSVLRRIDAPTNLRI